MAPKKPSNGNTSARDVLLTKMSDFKNQAPKPSKKAEVLANMQGSVARADFMNLTLEQAEQVIRAVREQPEFLELETTGEPITLAELLKKAPADRAAARKQKDAYMEAVATYIADNQENDDYDGSPEAISEATGVPARAVKGVLKRIAKNAA